MRNTINILIVIVFVVRLTVSSDYVPTLDANKEITTVELLASKKNVLGKTITFKTAQQLEWFSNPKEGFINTFDGLIKIHFFQIKNIIGFKVQTVTSLDFKISLLKIVLNDIILSKYNWI